MKKRIFIPFALAVLLLEVGFGVYVAFERKYESALNSLNLPIDSVRPVLIDRNRELEMASLLPEEDIFGDTSTGIVVNSIRTRPAGPKNAVKKPAPTSIAAAQPSKLPTKTEPDKQDVALKTPENQGIQAGDSDTQKEASRTNNKSFIAKTVSTLKKPIGWIKTIGSKLR